VSSGGPDFTRVAGQAVKGVANISSLQVVRARNTPFPNDPFFRYFFNGDDEVFGGRDRRSMSLGSGVIISADGYVITNNHVVGEHVREITIALPDKREIKGKVIGTDPTTDIALLKIPATGLPVLPWGDSSQLKVGEWVLAIGSPFQLSQTVTAGIVSATGRANMGFADYEDFIQTDAAINPGNSGGALINSRGELVGINTGIYSESGGYQGIGFAVPSKLARRVVDDLMQYGEVAPRIDRAARDRETDAAAGRGSRRHRDQGCDHLAHDAGVRGLRRRAEAWRRGAQRQWPGDRRRVAVPAADRRLEARHHRRDQDPARQQDDGVQAPDSSRHRLLGHEADPGARRHRAAMLDSRPSVTAERVAMRRAAHQVLDVPPVFRDPLALRIAGVTDGGVPREEGETARVNRHRRAFIAARSRYVEDQLGQFVDGGVDQYVVLGAGLDTFAYRNPFPQLRVFEVDHPATQSWKRERLASGGIPVPAWLAFAPINFEREDLADALSRVGFDESRPAFFGWLGVVAYLNLDAVFNTLRFVASCAPGTTIVFDYSMPPDRLPPRQRQRFDAIAGKAAAAGEPWRTFFEPLDLEVRLREIGFGDIAHVDADALNSLYFSSRTDGLRIEGVGRFAHLARARILSR